MTALVETGAATAPARQGPVASSTWDDRLAPGKHNAFDAVRLALATLVLLEHAYFLIDTHARRDPLSLLSGDKTNGGHIAVLMFFSLSGFLVTRSLMQSADIWNFLAKRMARIVPGFLLAAALGYLVVGPLTSTDFAGYFASQKWRAIILKCLTLQQTKIWGVPAGNPVPLVHGTLWTIKYEFDCYLLLAILALCGFLHPSLRAMTFICIAASLAAAAIFGLPAIDGGIPAFLISSPDLWPELLPFFFAGAAFYLYRDRIPKSFILLGLSFVLLAASFVLGGVYWALLLGGTYIVLYAALSIAAELRVRGRRVDLSYGVYLYGWPVQQMLLFYSEQTLTPLELFAASLVLSSLVAWLSWTFVEQPCLQLVRRERL
jgi:peptidoglycan/LPS O-acetylase OafA/YrhL